MSLFLSFFLLLAYSYFTLRPYHNIFFYISYYAFLVSVFNIPILITVQALGKRFYVIREINRDLGRLLNNIDRIIVQLPNISELRRASVLRGIFTFALLASSYTVFAYVLGLSGLKLYAHLIIVSLLVIFLIAAWYFIDVVRSDSVVFFVEGLSENANIKESDKMILATYAYKRTAGISRKIITGLAGLGANLIHAREGIFNESAHHRRRSGGAIMC